MKLDNVGEINGRGDCADGQRSSCSYGNDIMFFNIDPCSTKDCRSYERCVVLPNDKAKCG